MDVNVFNYRKRFEELSQELELRNKEKFQLDNDLEATEQEKQQLAEQTVQLQAEVEQAKAQVQEAEAKVQQVEQEYITNFEGLVEQVNNKIYPNAENIRTLPTVEACLNIIGGSIAQMPIYLYEKKKKGKKEIVDDNRAKLLNYAPNKFSNGYTLKKQMVIDYLIHGSATVGIERGNFDLVEALHYIPRNQVTARSLWNGYKVVGVEFDITVSGEGQQYGSSMIKEKKENVLYVVNNPQDYNPFVGTGVLETGFELFQRALQEDRYIRTIYENGALMRGILHTEGRLTAEGIEKLRKQMSDTYGGANANKTFVLEEGMKFDKTSMTPVDMELVKSKEQTNSLIATLFNVPESMLSKDGNKYGSLVENNKHFLKYCLGPIIKALESALNTSMLYEHEQDKFEFKFDTSELERASEADRIKMFAEGVQKGLFKINEAREALDYEPVEGGDDLQLPQNAVMLDTKTGKKVSLNAAREIIENEENSASDIESTEE